MEAVEPPELKVKLVGLQEVGNITVDGLEPTEKSCMVTMIVAECVRAPFEPVTITV